MNTTKPSIVYRYKTGLYVNLTNRCPTACVFCIKNKWNMDYRGANLNLEDLEPSPAEVARLAAQTYAEKSFDELVFCGYGEPAMRWDAVLETARLIRSGGAAPVPSGMKIRLNTNGLANLICGRNVAPELKGLVDAVHVSLNASEPGRWAELMRPQARYAEKGFESVKDFIRDTARLLPETIATIIDCDRREMAAFENLVAGLGAKPRVRAAL
ncbi:MAG: TatD family nuclease-associated radical SAM protein [Elusimicrobia bacterium]|nr:TatD family nuclease-associated radical SAM protein [Elusimicrobiota bacterium]